MSRDSWLLPYAGLVTLLFAIFAVLYATSQADVAKLTQMSESLKRAFSVSSHGSPDMKARRAAPAAPIGPPELLELQEVLEDTFRAVGEPRPREVSTRFDERGLIVRISARDLFLRGEAAPRQDLFPLLERVGRVLRDSGRSVRIEGHAGPEEQGAQAGARYAGTWELSAARAASIARLWVERVKLDPRRVEITGRAHYLPVSTETSSESSEIESGANRRVEIVVLPAAGP